MFEIGGFFGLIRKRFQIASIYFLFSTRYFSLLL